MYEARTSSSRKSPFQLLRSGDSVHGAGRWLLVVLD